MAIMNTEEVSNPSLEDEKDLKITSEDDLSTPLVQDLSKNQLKRMKKKEKWLATKLERRQKEREKLKLKKKAATDAGIVLPSRKRLKMVTMALSSCKQRIAVDMSFDHLMSEKDLAKCIKQLHRCYSNNRRVVNPAQFYLTSLTGTCLEVMEKNVGFRNWDINFQAENYMTVFDPKDVVYLTSDSDNVIQTLDETKVYIIGGLVDHNGHKGLCHDLAVKNNVSHGRLPIGEYLNMKTSRVLTIDHVYQILLQVAHGNSWRDAFLSIIPARKGAVSKLGNIDDNTDSNSTSDIDDDNKSNIVNETNEENSVTEINNESILLKSKNGSADSNDIGILNSQELT